MPQRGIVSKVNLVSALAEVARIQYVDCTLVDEAVLTPVPDISTSGNVINTARKFPEGAVLNLRFRLEPTGAEVQMRGEVRYCLPGVGAGVESVGIADSAVHAILGEIESARRAKPASSRPTRPKPTRRRAGKQR